MLVELNSINNTNKIEYVLSNTLNLHVNLRSVVSEQPPQGPRNHEVDIAPEPVDIVRHSHQCIRPYIKHSEDS